MHEEYFFQSGGRGLHPLNKPALVRMTAEFIQFHYFGPQSCWHAEDGHFAVLLHKFSTESIFCLKPGDYNHVSRIFDVVFEMVKNAAGFAHARRGNNYHGAAKTV